MSHPRSNGTLFHFYGAYGDSAEFSKNYRSDYMAAPAGSSSSVYMSDQAAIPSDLPDLYYDQDLPSPPSATSSNIISTPPPDLLTPWQQTKSNYSPSYPTPPWQSSPLISCQESHPAVPPIDTNCNWKDHAASIEPSVLFITSEEFDPGQQFHPYPFSYPQSYSHTQPNTRFEQSSSSSTLPSHFSSTNGSVPPNPSPVSSSNPSPSLPPLTLHQPRPSRRIPIISLSELASACDAFPIQTPAKDPRGRVSGEVLSPLSSSILQSHRTITGDPNIRIEPPSLHSTNSIYIPTFPWGTHDDQGKVLSCNCGCQESYIFT